jgi:opacity protein-like surface antigen
MKSAIIYLLLAACSLPLLAQTFNTKPGFIITLDGDTLRGLVRDRSDLSEQVLFKAEAASNFTSYTPDDIAAFAIEDEYFYEVKSVNKKKIFLLTLVKGTLSLYQLRERLYYIEKENGTLYPLEKKDTIIDNKFREDKRYIGVLQYLMPNCERVTRDLKTVKFTSADLFEIVKDYNLCINPDSTENTQTYKEAATTRIAKGVKVGFFSNQLTYFVPGGLYYRDEFEVKNSVTGGIFVRFFPKRAFSFQPELLLVQKGGTIMMNRSTRKEQTNISLTFLQVPFSIYYTLPTQKINPFIFAGGAIGVGVVRNVSRTNTTTGESLTVIIDNDDIAYRLGGGLEYKLSSSLTLQLEYMYEQSRINRIFVNNAIRTTGHGVKLGLCFY